MAAQSSLPIQDILNTIERWVILELKIDLKHKGCVSVHNLTIYTVHSKATLLKLVPFHSIFRYNPERLPDLEKHIREQAKGTTSYDLEVNLAVLKYYQFDPALLNLEITNLILLKALTNLPHTDFTLCKCLLLPAQMEDATISDIIELADILEKCDFELFWSKILSTPDLIVNVKGFFDAIRKFVCNVINITFQTISSDYLKRLLGGVDGKQKLFEIFFYKNC